MTEIDLPIPKLLASCKRGVLSQNSFLLLLLASQLCQDIMQRLCLDISPSLVVLFLDAIKAVRRGSQCIVLGSGFCINPYTYFRTLIHTNMAQVGGSGYSQYKSTKYINFFHMWPAKLLTSQVQWNKSWFIGFRSSARGSI
jgi:hypothetical protein